MTAEEFARVIDVSRETLTDLQNFVDLLGKWNPSINLVSRRSFEDIWARHVFDSAQLLDLVEDPPSRWIDIGSGGGFPGVVLALMARDRSWTTRFTMVESDGRKAAFLTTAVRQLDLPAEIIADRIEALDPIIPDSAGGVILSARALAPVTVLLGYASHIAPTARLIFPKGRTAETELTDAQEHWHIHATLHRSRTDETARILDISTFSRRETN